MTRLDVHARANERRASMTYTYELRPSDGTGTGPLEQEYSVDVNQDFVLGVRDRIDALLAQALTGNIDHRTELAKYGRELYKQLFQPGKGSDLVNRIRESTGPFQVRTDTVAAVVPWELLHDDANFLSLAYDLGRRSIVNRPNVITGRPIARIQRALIVGDPTNDLDAARHEAEHVAQWLRERGTDCKILLGDQANLTDVVMELGSPYDLFHFCGHVAVKHGTDYSGLMLHQRKLLDEEGLRTIGELGAPPVVFINGCDSAGRLANICMSFMVMGAKTVVGTSAEVTESGARRFSEEFYKRLLGGETMGAAVREARASLVDDENATWASFTLYGDPGEYIAAGSKKPLVEEKPQDGGEDAFTPETRELISEAEKLAAARGVVTSLDLLTVLVTTPELRTGIEERLGALNVAAVIDVLHTVLESTALKRAEGAATRWSDTVSGVIDSAVRRAISQGTTAATPRDLAEAFIESGGGSSANLLEAFGIPLGQLLSTGWTASSGSKDGSSGAEIFGDDGLLRADRLDDGAAEALRSGLLLAMARGELLSTYRLLRGFGLANSRVLRRHLRSQGEPGELAFRQLSMAPEPRCGDLSSRVLAALDEAARTSPEGTISEAALLYALLAQEGSSASKVLRRLGAEPEPLLRSLRSELGTDSP